MGLSNPPILTPVGLATTPDVIVQNQQTSGTAPAVISAVSKTWSQRVLNTIVQNKNAVASLASNKITLPSGQYYFEFDDSIAFANVNNSYKPRVYDNTNTVLLYNGQTYAPSGATSALAFFQTVKGIFTLTSVCAVSFDGFPSTSATTDGVVAATGGIPEVYFTVRIWKVA